MAETRREHYHPRILTQGAFLVAADGSVHSPMHVKLSSSQHFLSFNHWELTPEGVTNALDYAEKQLSAPKRTEKAHEDVRKAIYDEVWKERNSPDRGH